MSGTPTEDASLYVGNVKGTILGVDVTPSHGAERGHRSTVMGMLANLE